MIQRINLRFLSRFSSRLCLALGAAALSVACGGADGTNANGDTTAEGADLRESGSGFRGTVRVAPAGFDRKKICDTKNTKSVGAGIAVRITKGDGTAPNEGSTDSDGRYQISTPYGKLEGNVIVTYEIDGAKEDIELTSYLFGEPSRLDLVIVPPPADGSAKTYMKQC